MSPVKRFIGSKVIPAILLMFGLLSGWVVADNLISGWESKNWPTVEGVVTSSRIDAPSQSQSSSTKVASVSYIPYVFYTYFIRNQEYEGFEIISGGYSFDNRAEAEEVLKRYPINESVQVYVHPEKNKKSVLETGTSGFPFGFSLAFVLFTGLGIIFPRLFAKAKY